MITQFRTVTAWLKSTAFSPGIGLSRRGVGEGLGLRAVAAFGAGADEPFARAEGLGGRRQRSQGDRCDESDSADHHGCLLPIIQDREVGSAEKSTRGGAGI